MNRQIYSVMALGETCVIGIGEHEGVHHICCFRCLLSCKLLVTST